MAGWIKLHRDCLDHWLYTEYRPLTRREAWETILLTVNFEPSKSLIKGAVYDCGIGQSLLSLGSWAKRFVWSVQQVRTFFKLLEVDGMIKTEGLQYTTRLTVCNWDSYQYTATGEKHTKNRRTTDGQQTANKPLTTIKEGEEIEEGKEYKKEDTPTIGYDNPKRFIKPTIEQIQSYCTERKNTIDAQRFSDYYDANGWMVGKNKMKDWKAAVRTWEKNDNGKPKYNTPPPNMHPTYERWDAVNKKRYRYNVEVPYDAPMCPDNLAKWSTTENKWTHSNF